MENRNFKCKKCEWQNVDVKFRMGHGATYEDTGERLICECKRCGYTWNEKVSSNNK